jgi:uncharacterized protein (TIGR00251 family)
MPAPDAPRFRFQVRVTPRASRNEALGWDKTGTLRVRIRSAPTDGEANAELVAWLAKLLKLPKKSVRIVQGETARLKLIEITGLSELRSELKGAFP